MTREEVEALRLKYRTGFLTALRGSDIPMTVNEVNHSGRIYCLWFDRDNKLNSRSFSEDMLVGAGDQLIFENGVFVGAQVKVRGDVPL